MKEYFYCICLVIKVLKAFHNLLAHKDFATKFIVFGSFDTTEFQIEEEIFYKAW